MAYQEFAHIYDHLMIDTPYHEWETFLNEAASNFNAPGKKLLDIGCGTGEFTILCAKKGYEVTGVDLSSDMLTIARAKADEANVHISFFQQDMVDIDLSIDYDLAVIFCDSLNYLKNKDQVLQTFKKIYEHLHHHGLLLFDVHSLFKINQLFKNHDFSYNDEDMSYIWECFEGPQPNSVYHDLTFFVRQSSGLYKKFEETHLQTTWSVEEYIEMLHQVGFELLRINADFSNEDVNDSSERIFFVARKK